MLIHSPRPWEGLWDPNYPRLYKENLEVYKALQEAYSPIATGRLLNNQELINMANKYNVSVAQLCIRYCQQIGTLPLPKSKTKQHIKSNFEINFDIEKEDLEHLKSM